MYHAYKTEIKPTKEQAEKIRRNIGTCRWLYNNSIAKNQELYDLYKEGKLPADAKRFLTDNDIDKIVNHEIKTQNEFSWINECGSKARRAAEKNACDAFRAFFSGKKRFPRYKRKGQNDPKLYFPKNNETDWTVERHRIKIPTFGFVRLKEYGYIPAGANVISGHVSFESGRYYVSVVADVDPANVNGKSRRKQPNKRIAKEKSDGIGIDFGISNTAVTSDGDVFPNINKTRRMRRLEKIEKRERRRFSRKCEAIRNRKPIAEFIPPTDENGRRVETLVSKIAHIIKAVKEDDRRHGSIMRDYKRTVNREVRVYAKEVKQRKAQEAAAQALADAKANGLPPPKKIDGRATRTTINGYKKSAKQKRAEFKALPKWEQRRIRAEQAEIRAERLKQKRAEAAEKRKQRKCRRAFQKGTGEYKKKSASFYKSLSRIQNVARRKTNIRNDFQNKLVREVVNRNPAYIAIEDLSVSGLMKNKHLSKAFSDQRLRTLREKFESICPFLGIELRIVDRFFGSSKTCHHCHSAKKDIPLSVRTYKCDVCGTVEDRDFNAALNLRDTDRYLVYDEYCRRRKAGILYKMKSVKMVDNTDNVKSYVLTANVLMD